MEMARGFFIRSLFLSIFISCFVILMDIFFTAGQGRAERQKVTFCVVEKKLPFLPGSSG